MKKGNILKSSAMFAWNLNYITKSNECATTSIAIGKQSRSHFEIKPNKNTCTIDKVLLYGHNEKMLKDILLRAQTYSPWCRSFDDENNQQSIEENWSAVVERTG